MSDRGPRDTHGDVRTCSLVERVESLDAPPAISVRLVRDQGRAGHGFLRIRELELDNTYPDGSQSAPYRYFMVERDRLDAVAVVLYRREQGELELVLRSQLRPPLSFRGDYEVPLPSEGTGAVQWEIPAGLIEPGERGTAGLFARASAEALEEVGLVLSPSRFSLLGGPTSLSPGLIAEKLHFVCAEVHDGDERRVPEGDGHAVEAHSRSVFVPIRVALRALEDGLVHDIKTEVGIRRLLALSAPSTKAR